MTTKSRKKPAFVCRYIGIDTHFTERNGSTEQVYGIAAERPAGRKLAQDIAKHCNQLYADGYDVISGFPLTSGRAVEVSAEASEMVPGRTYQVGDDRESEEPKRNYADPLSIFVHGIASQVEDDAESEEPEINYYVDTGAGYSVTDGVIIIARLRQ